MLKVLAWMRCQNKEGETFEYVAERNIYVDIRGADAAMSEAKDKAHKQMQKGDRCFCMGMSVTDDFEEKPWGYGAQAKDQSWRVYRRQAGKKNV
jgi:hypothetical protein